MTIKIDGARALELLAHQVRDHENRVYDIKDTSPACRYEFNGCADCLIGRALHEAGVSIEVLRNLDKVGQSTPENTEISNIPLAEHGIHLTEKALVIFHTAQGYQDNGETWGSALEAAVHAAKDFGPERS